jgi:hypothetical protein
LKILAKNSFSARCNKRRISFRSHTKLLESNLGIHLFEDKKEEKKEEKF